MVRYGLCATLLPSLTREGSQTPQWVITPHSKIQDFLGGISRALFGRCGWI